jgi:hypothetical protein
MADNNKDSTKKEIDIKADPNPIDCPVTLPDPNGNGIVRLSPTQQRIVTKLKTSCTQKSIAQDLRCSQGRVSLTFKMPAVQAYLRAQLEAAGVTDGLLMKRIREGIDAKKEAKTGKGKIVDYTERREHVKLALRLQGLDAQREDEAGAVTKNTLIQIIMQAEKDRGLNGPTMEGQ